MPEESLDRARHVSAARAVAAAPSRPLMVYDGECGFCRRHVRRWERMIGHAVDFEPYQEAAARFPEIPSQTIGRAVHLVETDGTVSRGAAAVFRALSLGGIQTGWRWAYEQLPGVAPITEAAYRLVADHRGAADKLERWLYGHAQDPDPITWELSRRVFLRLLGIVYLIAFVSLWVQIDGLVGSRGILPIRYYLHAMHVVRGADAYRMAPTLCWLSASDAFLHVLCAAGVLLSCLLALGVAPGPVLALLFVAYLSLATAGQEFLSFQWDALLLETGFLAIFLAPLRLLPFRRAGPAPPASPGLVRWMFRWLLFRLMFLSGVVKLFSGDLTWRTGAALSYHFETQPLPTWISWYVHHLPPWAHHASALAMFFVELLVPLLMLGPRRLRGFAFVATVLFQLAIAATGNYGFFNLLTIVLCVMLLDDAQFPQRWRARLNLFDRARPRTTAPPWRGAIIGVAMTLLFFLTCVPFLFECGFGVRNRLLRDVYVRAAPFQIANPYGLFRVMTTKRPEIIIEGSDDGVHWKAYEFRYKPGDVNRRPRFVAPHMPRLDWQMWFEALSGPSDTWFARLLHRLLQGSPPVLKLFESNPFPDHPPHYIRARWYDYQFSDPGSGPAWWKRVDTGEGVPPVTLEQFPKHWE